jgi:hypothetical protein
MPTKRTFDLVLLTAILVKPALGLLNMSARRWARENEGVTGKVGSALVVLS